MNESHSQAAQKLIVSKQDNLNIILFVIMKEQGTVYLMNKEFSFRNKEQEPKYVRHLFSYPLAP